MIKIEKNCENCYWQGSIQGHCSYSRNKPKENMCDSYNTKCDACGGLVEYKLNKKLYCLDCILAQFDIEIYTTTHYMLDGEYLGSDEDMSEVIGNLKGVEGLD